MKRLKILVFIFIIFGLIIGTSAQALAIGFPTYWYPIGAAATHNHNNDKTDTNKTEQEHDSIQTEPESNSTQIIQESNTPNQQETKDNSKENFAATIAIIVFISMVTVLAIAMIVIGHNKNRKKEKWIEELIANNYTKQANFQIKCNHYKHCHYGCPQCQCKKQC